MENVTMPAHLIDPVYEEVLRAEMLERLPDRVYDAHVHLNRTRDGWHGWREFFDELVGAQRVAGGLLMPSPSPFEVLDSENEYVCAEAENDTGSVVGMLISPRQTEEEAEKFLLTHPRVGVLKPYINHTTSTVRPRLQSYISDFVPEWAWKLANRRHMAITLHIGRYRGGLSDPDTLATVLRVCNEYPDMKLILAHCALAHNPDTLKAALRAVSNLDNLYFDSSGISESDAYCYVLDGFGPKKLLYGSDYSMGKTPGRLVQCGSGLIGLDPRYFNLDKIPLDYACSFVSNGLEGLRAMFIALDKYGIDKAAQADIFCANAERVFGVREAPESEKPDAASSAELWFGGKRYIDISSDALLNAPLGYGHLRVTKAMKGGLLSGIPAGMDNPWAAALRGKLLEQNPEGRSVVLTRGYTEACDYAALCGGAVRLYGEEAANGYAFGAAVLDERQTEKADALPVPPLPGCGECRAALEVLEIVTTADFAARIEAIREEAARLYTAAGIGVSDEGAYLSLTFADEAARNACLDRMEKAGFLAGDRFVPTFAHTPQIMRRLAEALAAE